MNTRTFDSVPSWPGWIHFDWLPHNRPQDFRMVFKPRDRLPIALLGFVIACNPTPPQGPERCGPGVPASAQHPISVRPGALAGDYRLIQVQTQPTAGKTSVGHLHLAPLDSVSRAHAVGGAVRDLVGWLDTVEGDTAWRPNAASRDPARPGAVLAGDHLRLGEWGAADAHAEHLMITAVAPEGFWGWWKAEPGWDVDMEEQTRRVRPDPAGYFCALRAGS